MFSSILTWLTSSTVGQIIVKGIDVVSSIFNAKNTSSQQVNAQAQDIQQVMSESTTLVEQMVNQGKNTDEYRQDVAE